MFLHLGIWVQINSLMKRRLCSNLVGGKIYLAVKQYILRTNNRPTYWIKICSKNKTLRRNFSKLKEKSTVCTLTNYKIHPVLTQVFILTRQGLWQQLPSYARHFIQIDCGLTRNHTSLNSNPTAENSENYLPLYIIVSFLTFTNQSLVC